MRITPLDVRGHRFAVRMRGYDREEVQSFLNFVSEEFEKAVSEASHLREETAQLKSSLGDLTEREREAEKHGFSYVELDGKIGVIGNGAGLTMATLDLIEFYGGKAANFLDVGGGAESERVMNAVRLVASVPSVKVIVVNLLGGITKCDEVAKGIIAAGISQKVIVRLAGTNEAEGRRLLSEKGYEMLDTMDLVVKKAVEVTA